MAFASLPFCHRGSFLIGPVHKSAKTMLRLDHERYSWNLSYPKQIGKKELFSSHWYPLLPTTYEFSVFGQEQVFVFAMGNGPVGQGPLRILFFRNTGVVKYLSMFGLLIIQRNGGLRAFQAVVFFLSSFYFSGESINKQ